MGSRKLGNRRLSFPAPRMALGADDKLSVSVHARMQAKRFVGFSLMPGDLRYKTVEPLKELPAPDTTGLGGPRRRSKSLSAAPPRTTTKAITLYAPARRR